MQYISPEDYARAERNGLSKELVYQRVYEYHWDVKDAVSIPKKITKRHGNWVKVALENGISRSTFYNRLSRGMPDEEAATSPLKRQLTGEELAIVSADLRRTYPKAYGLLADANGISRTGFRERLKRGWSLEDAATYPVMARGERKVTRDALLKQRGLRESSGKRY